MSSENQMNRFFTGVPVLDQVLAGGLPKPGVCVVGYHESHTKLTMMGHLVTSAIRHDNSPVACFSDPFKSSLLEEVVSELGNVQPHRLSEHLLSFPSTDSVLALNWMFEHELPHHSHVHLLVVDETHFIADENMQHLAALAKSFIESHSGTVVLFHQIQDDEKIRLKHLPEWLVREANTVIGLSRNTAVSTLAQLLKHDYHEGQEVELHF